MDNKYLKSGIENIDISSLSDNERLVLCEEIRTKILDVVSKNGGHLASNLGVVELTVALLSVFDYKKDKIVFDVGHQSYAYKLLTGRLENFETLRTRGGVSGFPRISESKYDRFDTGHSATALSAALGFAHVNRLNKSDDTVIAIIGDGAMTGGPAYEAINDIGHSDEKIIVILNDNEMSIDRNVGGLSKYMAKIRLSAKYIDAKHNTESFMLTKLPVISKPFIKAIMSIKDFFRFLINHKEPTIFEDLGLVYYGPVDGHNVNELIDNLEAIKLVNAPVLLHICTKKGKGYNYAEEKPSNYHGVSPFDLSTGVKSKTEDKVSSFTDFFGRKICDSAKKNHDIVAICAAMSSGTGLDRFAKEYPDRFFDCGIAEEHCVTMAGAMALSGKTPVVAIYSTFLQRSYDQIIEDVCFMNNHVVFCLDRAGFVGPDGHTHNGLFDISYMLSMPNLTVFVPVDYEDFDKVFDYSVNMMKSPASIRYPKTGEYRIDCEHNVFKPRVIADNGDDFAIITCGTIQAKSDSAFMRLTEMGYKGKNINLCQIKPMPTKDILELVKNCRIIFTVEEGIVNGGFGAYLRDELVLNECYIPVHNMGIRNPIVHCGTVSEQFVDTSLDADSLVSTFSELLK